MTPMTTDLSEQAPPLEEGEPENNTPTTMEPTQSEEPVPGGWQPGDDPELAPEGAFLGTHKLSGQIGLLPETCAVKFTGTVGLEGQFNVGEVIEGSFRAIVSGDNTSGKVKDGELGDPGRVQTATILSAKRV